LIKVYARELFTIAYFVITDKTEKIDYSHAMDLIDNSSSLVNKILDMVMPDRLSGMNEEFIDLFDNCFGVFSDIRIICRFLNYNETLVMKIREAELMYNDITEDR
jgi:hypothetical protein